MVGVRRSDVKFDSEDHYITATNGDDSGGVSYGATSPVGGLIFKPSDWLRAVCIVRTGISDAAGLRAGLSPGWRGRSELRLAAGPQQ